MTPIDYYREQNSKGLIVDDQHQWMALQSLQQLHHDLLIEHKKRSAFYAAFRRQQLVRGLYLWGGVGIGKTFLMDCFYQSLPFPEKMRMHFHHFMQMVHQELKKHQGKKDPLQFVANEIAQKCMVLCFDELTVSDITDAMLLGRLISALFTRGVCLIATSNILPDDLYKDGVQRRQFFQGIALLKHLTTVLHLSSTIDYRSQHLSKAGVFFSPNDEAAHKKMDCIFTVLANGKNVSAEPIEIHGRIIQTHKQVNDVVWFDFAAICHVPRSQLDYLAIAKKFHTIFISNIPVIPGDAKNRIALFIRLVDVFYDAKVRLICSAETQVKQIYTQGHLFFDYARTYSRLLEMQSEAYFLNARDNKSNF